MPKHAINHFLLGMLFDNGKIIGTMGEKEDKIWLRFEIPEMCCLSDKQMQELMAFLLIQDLKGDEAVPVRCTTLSRAIFFNSVTKDATASLK